MTIDSHDGLWSSLSAASLDRPFVNIIRNSFRELGLSEEISSVIILVLFVTVLLLAAGLAYNLIKNRYKEKDAPSGWVIQKSRILRILNLALDARSNFEVKFFPSEKGRKSTYFTLMELSRDLMVMEPPAFVRVSNAWVNRDIEGFFKAPESANLIVFYHFISTIVGVKVLPDGMSRIQVEIPQKLELHQKRSFLRVDPPSHYILGFALWSERSENMGASIKYWGKPVLTYVPEKAANPMKIENISAGGLRVTIRYRQAKSVWKQFAVSQRYFILLDLFDPESTRKQRYWLKCRVQNMYENFQTKDIELGLQFLAWGRLKKAGSQDLAWTELSGQGIETLAGWVMKRHLELYREKGLA